MTQPRDEERIEHMVAAVERALAFVADRSRADLDDDTMLQLALTKLVEIVGEAAKGVSEATRSDFPRVPWSSAARMRDRLVHHYFDIDVDELRATVTEDLPTLLAALRASS